MWTKPRQTMRAIVNTNPKRSVVWLATIFILQNLLFIANYYSLGINYHYAMVLIILIVLSPLIGMVWLYLFGWILHFTGRWLGGKAPLHYIRSALAWSKLPALINLAMWFILLVFSANYVFIQFSEGPSLFFTNLISIIAGVWSLVLLIQNIREVQGFSVGRAIGNWAIYFVFSLIISTAISAAMAFLLTYL